MEQKHNSKFGVPKLRYFFMCQEKTFSMDLYFPSYTTKVLNYQKKMTNRFIMVKGMKYK